jgi:sugar transferase (PEP-CTERM/EpsH1 system associated)
VRVLVLTHRLPYAPNRGDRIRAYHILRLLATHADVELVSLVHDDEEAGQVAEVERLGVRTAIARVARLGNYARGLMALAGPQPLTHCLLDAPALERLVREAADRRPDVVLAYCSGMARFALRPPLDAVPTVLDMVDVDSAKWQALAQATRPPRRWIYAREHDRLQAFERIAAAASEVTLVVNEREQVLMQAIAPGADVRVLPNGVDVERFTPNALPHEGDVAVFTGVMDYAPNEEAAAWIAREVWPHVVAARPLARLRIVGANPSARVRALASANVEVVGSVPDTRPYLWGAALAVAPLLTARGVQNKVLEAVAAGLPVVVTPAVAEGLPEEASTACLVGGGPAAFAGHVVALLGRSPHERRAIATSARLHSLSWEARLAPLPELLAAAARGTAPRVKSAS